MVSPGHVRPFRRWFRQIKKTISKSIIRTNLKKTINFQCTGSRSTFEFPGRSTFPVPVCTVSPGHWVNKADTQ